MGWIKSLPKDIPIFVDRLPIISEYIYGPVLRGKCQHGLKLQQMAAILRDAFIIYCRPNWAALAVAVKRENQLEGVLANHHVIVKAYDELMGRLELECVRVHRYDYTGPPQMIMDSVRSFLRG